MINNLNDSKYLLRDGVLYKSCPSCSRHSNQDVYYPCPRCFGYRHDNERRPFIQSLCYNCRGSKGYNGLSDWYAFEQDDDIIMSSIRVLPTSKEVFPRLKDIKEFLTIVMPNRGNTYYYKRHNLSVDKNALILFQYNNQIIAYGIYESECSINESDIQFADGYTGYYKFKDNSIKILEEPIISKQFYNYIMQNPNEYTKISRLLEDVYQNGTNCIGNYNLQNYDADYLINLIFWMTLQDEINYPQPRKSGRKMPFCRYFEAIYCANFQANFSINNVIVRCNNRGYIPNLYNNLINLVNFYN